MGASVVCAPCLGLECGPQPVRQRQQSPNCCATHTTPPSPLSPRSAPLQFARLRFEGCSFLVAGRRAADSRFRTLADIEMPGVLPRDVRSGRASSVRRATCVPLLTRE